MEGTVELRIPFWMHVILNVEDGDCVTDVFKKCDTNNYGSIRSAISRFEMAGLVRTHHGSRNRRVIELTEEGQTMKAAASKIARILEKDKMGMR